MFAVALALVAGTVLVPIPGLAPVQAQEQNTQNIAVTSANAPSTATQTQPSGLQVTYGIAENTGNIDGVTGSGGISGTGTMSAKGGTNTLFEPDLDLTRNALYMNVDYGNGSGGTACTPPLTNGATSTCANRGTITVNFSQPVDNPTLHLTGLGGNLQNNSVPVLVFSGAGRLTGSQGATAATFGPVAAGTNLTTTSTSWSTTNPRANPTCTANLAVSNGATAGCGSIPIRGTGLTQLTMAIDLNAICLSTTCGTLNTADASEQFGMVVTTAQDWGDAPTSYNGTQAPAHAVTNLRLGSAIDNEDTLTQANQTTSPYAVAAGTSANGSNGDGADEDAFGSLPDVLAQGTAPYTLTVPISGATKPGTVAGWIDFNRNGVFDTGERAAATFVAGATSATLTFAKPAGLTAGTTYARFRTSYVATDVAQPTGLASSGEVEDYSLTIASEAPALSLVKSAGAVVDANSSGRQDAGDTVPYTFTVTNTGNTVLQGVAVTDPKIPSVACSTTTLAVGASATCTGSYTLTQADVEAGSVPNTATVNAQSPNGTAASATASTTRSVTRTPAITLAKTAGTLEDVDGNGPDVGDTIPYTFTITNSGNVALATTRVDDAKVGSVSCPTGSLAPGATRSCTATYTLTQADVDAGRVVNTATATGTSAAGPATSAEATATRTFTPSSSFGFTKQAAPVVDVNTNGRTDAGDTVRYTFTFTNTGATTLSGAAVSDPRVGPVTCPTAAVAPGGTVSCARTYTLTQADVDSGAVNNTATGTMAAPEGRPAPVSRTASVSTPITAANTLGLVKSAGPVVDANGSGRQDAGDTIAYSFRVTNNGNQTLDAPAVSDPKVGAVVCGPTSIAPGATITCTATYRLTQADVDAGQVANTATATAADPRGFAVASGSSSTSTTVTRVPSLALDKIAETAVDADADGRIDAGDTVRYRFEVRNSGTVTLDPVRVTDTRLGTVTCPTGPLAPGATVACTPAVYSLTQADADAGSVNNTATATGTPPAGAAVTSTDSTSTSFAVTATVALAKTAGAVQDLDGNGPDAGDRVAYGFTVTNTGTASLTGVRLTDPRLGGAVACTPTTLGGGATATCSGTYTLTQADVDAGQVVNTASVEATGPQGQVVRDTATATRSFTPASSFVLDKQAGAVATGADGRVDAGDTVPYSFVLTNTGSTTLRAADVSDPRLGPVTCAGTSIAPGASVTCTKSYVLTQADVDSGAVNNSATATMQAPDGRPQPAPSSDSTSTVLAASGALGLTKTAGPVVDANTSGRQDAGDTVTYTFLVTNNGNRTLSGVSVTDPTTGPVSCPTGTLAPGQSRSCTVTYTLTQADVDAGQVVNTATARATDGDGRVVTSGTATATRTVARVPSLVLDKQAGTPVDTDGDGRIAAGDTIRYTFSVRNSGTVTLDPVTVSDPLLGTVECPAVALAPGATLECTPVVLTITQAQADAGAVNNTATATGRPPTGPAVTSIDGTSTTLQRASALALTKTAGAVQDLDGNGPDAGDTVAYTVTARNAGTTTLTGVRVTDPLLPDLACGATTLGPRASLDCTGTYTLTQADVDAGRVVNTATATATAPGGVAVAAQATATRPFTPASSFSLDKQAAAVATGADGRADAGDTIAYSFVLTNDGATTLSGADVEDPRLGAVTCPTTAIAPGASLTCTKSYVLTQADVDSGAVNNVATATMRAPEGRPQPLPRADDTSTTLAPANVLRLAKEAGDPVDANDSDRLDAGDTVTYTFTVTNDGNRTLDDVAIDDPLVDVTCTEGELAPGASRTCTATYTLAQADLDEGEVVNTATATAAARGGALVESLPAVETTPLPTTASVLLDKEAGTPVDTDEDGRISAGDTVRYTFAVRNTGTVTLDPVTVDDALLGEVTCPEGPLRPGTTVDCTPIVLTITQAQADAGAVNNTATATGTPPEGDDVTSVDSTSTPLVRASSLALAKTSDPVEDLDANGPDAGDTVDYTLVVTNTGTTTLDDVAVTDALLADLDCAPGTLEPGDSATCAGTHTLTQADVDAGQVVNTADATGTDQQGVDVDATDTETRTFAPRSAFVLDKVAADPTDVDGDGRVEAADSIDYDFVLTNTGATTLSGAEVDDPRVGPVTCPDGPVAPGTSVTCSVTYDLTQADVDAGAVNNTATATLDAPEGRTDPAPSTDSTSTTLAAANTLTLAKVAGPVVDANDSDRVDAGDTVAYTFTVRNDGNQTLTDVAIDDPLVAATCPDGDLEPGEEVDCTATYTLVQADVDAGEVLNTASASAVGPRGVEVTSAEDSTRTEVARAPDVAIDKVADTPRDVDGDGRIDADDTIRYTFVVSNTGTVTLDEVELTDPLVGLDGLPCGTGGLAPGRSVECAVRVHTITQEEADAGSVDNTATVTAQTPAGEGLDATDSTSTPTSSAVALTLDKTSVAPTDPDANGPDAGDVVAYSFLVTNTGSRTLTDLVVADPLAAVDCPVDTLAPGASTTCTATHALTQAEVDAGQVVNTATAEAVDPAGTPAAATDTETRRFTPRSAFTLDKQASAVVDTDGDGAPVEPGDTIEYDFVLANTGATTLSGAEVDDPRVGPVTCPDGDVAPGASVTCERTYVLTQQDIDSGAVNNTATATLEAPEGRQVPQERTDSTSTTLVAANVLGVEKSAGPVEDANDSERLDAGDTIDYTVTVTNDGNQTLTDVTVTDELVDVTCPAGDLGPGDSVDCTATYTLTQADVDAGEVVNEASATAVGPRGAIVPSGTATTTTPLAGVATIELDKVAEPPRDVDDDGRVGADDTIRYTFRVENTGTVTLDDVRLDDALVGLDGEICGDGRLAPGQVVECAVRVHTITQAEVDAGAVDNTAAVTGTPPAGPEVDDTDATSTPTTADATLSLEKSSAPPTDPDANGVDAGDVVAYSFAVTNTGTRTLTGLAVSDPLVGAVTCPDEPLVPGETVTCTGTHALTQAEVDAGAVVNEATATAEDADGTVAEAADTDTRPLAPASSFALDKQASAVIDADGDGGPVEPGDTIEYDFVLTNDGGTTLSAADVDDPRVGPVTCPDGAVAPGGSVTCGVTYVVTQGDIDSGAVNNTATATMAAPEGRRVPVERTDSTSTALVGQNGLTLDKTAGPVVDDQSDAGTPDAGRASAGDTITYTFLVENTGNQTLSGVAIDDPRLGPVTCPPGDLAPGGTRTCEAVYTLTQADVDDGEVVNSAGATAAEPDGDVVLSLLDGTRTELAADPAIALDKAAPEGLQDTDADGDDAGRASAGDTIEFTFEVTNTGNTTLDPVVVEDPLVGEVTCPTGPLAPGDSVDCDPVTYEVTQDDVDAGAFANTATAIGTPPTGPAATDDDSTSTTLERENTLEIVKVSGALSDPDGNGTDAGDVLDYSFTITNTGSTRLRIIAVTDPALGETFPCSPEQLDPGQSSTCNGTYTLTQADVDAGEVVNTATGSAVDPEGNVVDGSDTDVRQLEPRTSFTFDKKVAAVDLGADGRASVGDTIDYGFTFTNTGASTLDTPVVDDPTVGPVGCPPGDVAPGASVTCTVTYELTQADVDAGAVNNTATGSIDAPPALGDPADLTDETSVPLAAQDVLTLDKTAGDLQDTDADGRDTDRASAGDTITYTFLVTNNGNRTLTDVAIDDPLVDVDCPDGDLAPGGTRTCEATYTLTQADVDAGEVVNTAAATATGPRDTPVRSADSGTRTELDRSPALELDKAAPGGLLDTDADGRDAGRASAGDTIAFTFSVENTGNTTLDPVVVEDPLVGEITCPTGPLAPGESVDCDPVTYEVTQDDVDSGAFDNTATATATPPAGADVTDQDSTSTTLTRVNTLTIDKVSGTLSDPDGNGPDVGDVLDYSFSITNTGSTRLRIIAVTDPALGGTFPCSPEQLDPGQTSTCNGTYTLTQADVDAGQVENSADGSAVDPEGNVVTGSDTDVREFSPRTSYTFDKEVAGVDLGADGRASAGDTIAYAFTFTNTGATTLDGPAVDDPTVGDVDCPTGPVAPGASVTCSATYELTQADVDAGSVNNTATGSIDAPPALEDPVDLTDETSVPLEADDVLTLAKTAGDLEDTDDDGRDAGRASAGDTITYSFLVTNNGNRTLTDVAIDDPLVDVTCPDGPLGAGLSVTCEATYVLNQADVDAGEVVNTAAATALGPRDTPVRSADSGTRTELEPDPSLALDKDAGTGLLDTDADGADAGRASAGDTIRYTFTVENTGSTTLDPVVVEDALVGDVTCPAGPLAPGEAVECTPVTYEVTQDDIDAGSFDNTATATGTPPTGPVVTSDDSTSTLLGAAGDVTLTKTAGDVVDVDDDGADSVGDTITYDLRVENTGNVRLTDVVVDDPLLGGAVDCAATALDPGQGTDCGPVTYVLTQADVEAGEVRNTADVTAEPPVGDPATDSAETLTPLEREPALSLDKEAGSVVLGADGRVDAGDTLPFTFRVRNTGNVVLTDVAVSDPLVGDVTCPAGPLAPGDAVDCTADAYVLTQADIDSGAVNNLATATADSVAGEPEPSRDETSTTLGRGAAVQLAKTAGGIEDANDTGRVDAGDTVGYTFVVTNAGNVTLEDVVVTDPLVGDVGCDDSTLAPGDSTDCAAVEPYVLTQADVDAGEVLNLADVTATGADGTEVVAGASERQEVGQVESLALDKQAGDVDTGADGRADAGDTIDYTFRVTNTGTTTLRGVTIDDPLVGAVDCPVGDVAPGDSVTCGPVAYELTQDDVDEGEVVNTASASAIGSGGALDPVEDTETQDVAADASVDLAKSAGTVVDVDDDGMDSAGDTITYDLLVENTGNVTLDDVTVTDPLLGGAVPCAVDTLAPDGTTPCGPVTYVLTQADVEAGERTNLATVEALGADGTPVDDEAATRTPLEREPALLLEKEAGAIVLGADGRVDEGDTLPFTLRVRNTGNVALTGVAVSDPLLGEVDCPAGPLAPGDAVDCTADVYVLTQADVDAGEVRNTATATADSVVGAPEPDADSTTTTFGRGAGVQLVKTAGEVVDANDSGREDAGDTIAYTFVVENLGNVTLRDVVVTDPLVGEVDCDVTTLAPGDITDCAAVEPYELTQADVDAGEVLNTADVTATGADGTEVGDDSSARRDVAQAESFTFEKEVVDSDDGGDGRADEGDTIDYRFVVTNTGTTTLRGVTVDDPLLGAVSCPTDVFGPEGSVTCGPVSYPVTQAQLDAGEVVNAATATALGQDGVVGPEDDTVTTSLDREPAVQLTKTAGTVQDLDDDRRPSAGDTITFDLAVENTGNVTLSDVSVVDPLLGGAVACESDELAPGGTTPCGPVTYVLTQADVEAGVLRNTATVTADPPAGDAAKDTAGTETSLARTATFTLDKQAGAVALGGDGRVGAGDAIIYTFTVRNTGNVALTDVAVTDPLVGVVDCTPDALAPDRSVTCTAAPYELTQADVDAGAVNNTATATADSVVGPPDEQTDSTSTALVRAAAVQLEKTGGTIADANDSGRVDAGDTIDYTFVVSNPGNVTVDELDVTDPLVGTVSCDAGSVEPGDTVECAADAPYVLTQADVDAGQVVNTATVTGVGADGEDVADADTETSPVARSESIALTKTAGDVATGPDGRADAGDTISYTFTVTNTGTTTVRGTTIEDPMVGAVGCPAGTVAPRGSVTCGPVAYELTQADVDAGEVENTAVARALGRTGAVDPAEDTEVQEVAAAPAVTLTKSAGQVLDTDGDGQDSAGDSIVYTLSAENTGNVTLTDVTVTDPLLGGEVDCAATTLAPGRSTACDPVTYVLTQADVEAGEVVNTARVVASPPLGDDVDDTAGTRTPVDREPVLELDKRAGDVQVGADGRIDAGDTIAYSFTVLNRGNVALTDVTVTDPLVGAVTCPTTPVEPGRSVDCTADPYVLTQADVDSGAVNNTATAAADSVTGAPGPDADSTSTTFAGSRVLLLEKTAPDGVVDANDDGVVSAGDTIDYAFRVTNDGAVTLADVTVDDPRLGDVTCPTGDLEPGEGVDCAADPYVLTQADVDAGQVVNTATVSADDPKGDPVTGSDTLTTQVAQTAELELTKEATGSDDGGDGRADAGDTIEYTFTVRNTGPTTLRATTIEDPLVGAVSCPAVPFGPGETVECGPVDHEVTQADLDAGEVENTATARATGPAGLEPSDADTITTSLEAAPSLELRKSAGIVLDANDTGRPDAGDTIDYTFEVENTGNVTLDAVTVTDPLVGGDVACEQATVAPGETIDCGPATYTVTEAAADAGEVVNTAAASGEPPVGDAVTDDDEVTTDIVSVASLEVLKTGVLQDEDGDDLADAGETIRYEFVVTNTGTVRIDGVAVQDSMLDAAGDEIVCAETTLPAGESTTCVAEHVVTAEEAASNAVVNVATATGSGPDGSIESDVDQAVVPAVGPVDDGDGDGDDPGGDGDAGDADDRGDGPFGILPDTGGAAAGLLLLALGLLAGGLLLLRRRTTTEQGDPR